jgi:hypothetical protein
MTKITSYQELLLEKHRLKLQLHAQKELVRQDFDGIKESLKPVQSAIGVIAKLTTRDPSNPLISGTVNTIIDSVVRNVFLSRAGWFMKLAVPFVMKNFASHAIDEKKDKILSKIFSFFGKKNKAAKANGQYHYEVDDDE